jgi:hypothetical protein
LQFAQFRLRFSQFLGAAAVEAGRRDLAHGTKSTASLNITRHAEDEYMIHVVRRLSQTLLWLAFAVAFVFIAGALGDAQAQTERKSTPQATTSTQRAAPATRKTTVDTSGVTVQGAKVKANSGFVLEVKQNQVSARKIGGGLGLALDCVCKYGTGNCEPSSSGDQAVCTKTAGAPCLGQCTFVPLPGGGGGATMTRGTTGVNRAPAAVAK